jgi:hypothetical protein
MLHAWYMMSLIPNLLNTVPGFLKQHFMDNRISYLIVAAKSDLHDLKQEHSIPLLISSGSTNASTSTCYV